MKVVVLSNIEYQTIPLNNSAIEVDENLLKRIGIDKQFVNGEIVDYVPIETNEQKIIRLKAELNKYKEDVEQVELFDMERADYQEKKARCAEIIIELRQLESEVRDVSL